LLYFVFPATAAIMALGRQRVAIDLLALLGRPVLFEIRHPHVPKVSLLQETLRSMRPDEKKDTLDRARELVKFGRAVEEAIVTMKTS